MFTDFRKKTFLANWLPWQQGNVYFWFLKLKILLIPCFEKLPSFKVPASSVLEFWANYWAWGGNTPPPVLIGLIFVQYIRGYLVHFGMYSTLGDIMSTSENVYYNGGYHDVCGRYPKYSGNIMHISEHHGACGGISWVHWGDIIGYIFGCLAQ